ncbi:N(4)-(Beta-N-acetylglucosaminyl)-L-asparaginase (Glycosylasparaginase) (Aspartylglucosaminidase) (N4-(N-acetyl-beta-glucosaminyl)-L-asparagine amidase) (AGA) [Microscilla marina ATCC 23134]|uniref:N(4)-(Beta-N-acetylglucosaminyl)-L-asparaginase (Glycosylasparaginase) (Aspartylglucosaminidase) (N4-(N-acetyl-beta-glucosaminyl)-L-asparagine amidase) (AGA) n=1 Tax=Microscilla marina ATCC 23134 TaxID=313606 RepID=A1ZP94_MICM2|nr:N(4)-(Beta-N-acetylglucosaminyl)-L-asparaginase (Glycosylasparaginase) (Aspartylglucosaminidase) (N4-(N-acetyl-beta-glucosaminyl)-L-asparagine amidase) (AGA) [Microscilla marina ATCC 23134]
MVAAAASIGLGHTSCQLSEKVKDETTDADVKKGTLKQNPRSKPILPVVIATWNHGIAANEAAMRIIAQGSKAIDAVEAGVKVTEADPDNLSVGYGGLPDRDGNVTLDACIMDEKGNAGSVSFLQHIKHPISVARKVMDETPHVMLSGAGALQFALQQGFKKENLLTDKAKKQWEEWKEKAEYKPIVNIENHDTIGLLAIDKHGDISGACTTSGLAYKMHGRVGDSPVIGAGMFVDNEVGGACATGLGEAVLKTLGAFLIVELMRQGLSPQEACEEGVRRITKKQGYQNFQIGYLALNKKGEHGAYSIQPGFNYALHQADTNELIDAPSFMKKK